ncbi:hypothetical protein B296_00039546 [Ensete ventricosum]|uniref:Drought induced 19 protein type zinc-binding domain-containing protein n=1 Tax=Ensete ventricosum TaxID=4639 RepID=A0A426ZBK1_ENSVE|nr:hypothetical protein B296_00039546 [Ensete ventricosum]
MEADTRSHLSAASKRYHPALQSRYVLTVLIEGLLGLVDAYLGFEELDGGENEPRPEFACPFCSEVFDVVGLCCHMDDEHPVEAKNGVCPVCAARVGMDMVGHLTTQHANFLKISCSFSGSWGSNSTILLLKKDKGNMQSLVGGSSCTPSNAAPDPLLSSFIFNLPVIDPPEDAWPEPLDERSMVDKISEEKLVERYDIFWWHKMSSCMEFR